MSHQDYHADDCVFSVPTGYADRSVHILEWPIDRVEKVVLVVQREARRAGETIDAYVERAMSDHATKLAGYAREPVTDRDGAPHVRRVAFRWMREGFAVFQHQAFVEEGPSVLLFAGTAKARYRDEVDRVLDRVIDSLRFREGA